MEAARPPERIPEQRPHVGAEELDAVRRVLESGWLGMGPVAREFEAALSELTGAAHVVACASGTAALHLALVAAGVGRDDEVIVPSMTHVASVQAICSAGAAPVFCEVQPDTITIDVSDALARVTSRTRAIMPVHYGGRVCDLDALLPAARERGLEVVEDAAQAFGSSRNGTAVGALGDLTCFSFDPLKNVTCVEGGAVATSRPELASRVRSLRSLGTDRDSWTRFGSDRPWAYTVESQGFRYWLSDVNAAIGLAQLGRLDAMRARKLEIAGLYDDALGELSGIEPIPRDPVETFPFLYTVRVLDGRRDALLAHLAAAGIDAWVRPLPNHLQPAFPGSAGDLPISERLFGELMTLPFFVRLTEADCGRVIAATRSFFGVRS